MHGTMRALAVINPRPAAKSNPRGKSKKKHRAVAHRRNPRILGIKLPNVFGDLGPAVIGAGGAIALDVGLGLVPLPEWLATRTQVGLGRTALRILGAYGVEWLAKFFLKGQMPAQLRNGALIVIANDEVRSIIRAQFPQLGLAAYIQPGDLAAYLGNQAYNALPTIARIERSNAANGGGVNAYVSAEMNGLLPVTQ